VFRKRRSGRLLSFASAWLGRWHSFDGAFACVHSLSCLGEAQPSWARLQKHADPAAAVVTTLHDRRRIPATGHGHQGKRGQTERDSETRIISSQTPRSHENVCWQWQLDRLVCRCMRERVCKGRSTYLEHFVWCPAEPPSSTHNSLRCVCVLFLTFLYSLFNCFTASGLFVASLRFCPLSCSCTRFMRGWGACCSDARA
jgi:hypothetical protein